MSWHSLKPWHQTALCLLGAITMLSGCTTTTPELASSYRYVPPEGAFITPAPGGPAMLSVVERRYSNATEQKIILAAEGGQSGENYINVSLFTPVGIAAPGANDSTLSDQPLRSSEVVKEIHAALPGVPMRQAGAYVQNQYGPFSYAVGRAGSGDVCIYTWQRITGTDNTTLIMRARGTIQLRMRLCSPNQSEEQLLQYMYGFTINAFIGNFQWNPYGDPMGPDERLGKSGQPIFPVAGGGFNSVLPNAEPAPVAAPAQPARRAAARSAPAQQTVTPAPLPQPTGPAVPLPPAASAPAAPQPAAAAPPPPPTTTNARPAARLCLPSASGDSVECN
ncbi:cellulose biosynthesis protein BcsN [Aureimonas fodinaquatilis]|uniref:Cellulose biosynthesis protein BcsN n=1 Tax=Aureimonas fodinaquatilis TaxID=2565783 RepID=A0A5B0DPP2_9HYPH|nr:cellulose biosynthesis protein BcsN [Aureimonas fodinaquatilis]KAA0968446.1 cellulose biosynthesis protein BcsN [Aureimonas fodinaquatilis]